MTNLTDKWKKGELPDGEYWCLSICGDIDKLYCYQNSFWKYKTEDDYYGLPVEIKQVLSEVPNYNEYQKLLSDQLAKNEGVEINAELEAENAQLKKWCEEFNALEVAKENAKLKTENKWYSEQLNEAVKEVSKLKELLKEVRGKLKYVNTPRNNHNIFGNDLMKKIDQVLGEE